MVARPERFELPTSWFVARRSIQLSYGRRGAANTNTLVQSGASRLTYGVALGRALPPALSQPRSSERKRRELTEALAEREGFEPSMGF